MNKKRSYFILILIFLLNIFAFTQNDFLSNLNYEEYTLENGMNIFVLEDFSSATIRVEYSVRAGFSSQSKDNTGFFSLYTRLLKNNSKNYTELKDLTAECNSDSSRYIIITTPAKLRQTLTDLSALAFAPSFSDSTIKQELSELKNEVMQYAYTPQAFINASIDSRVFSLEPWKQDSSIYPDLFSKTTPAQARNTLSSISRTWYVPQNSVLFISGSINKEAALILAKETFGQFAKAAKNQTLFPAKASNKTRKYVMYDSQFSEDLTQIVVQYASLQANQCDIAATAMNSNYSSLKEALVSEKTLNIRGQEYINVAAAHKNGTSRLILQSLLEKNKTSPVEQSELFLQICKNSIQNINEQQYFFAKKLINYDFNSITSNSTIFMEYLSQFWAFQNEVKDYSNDTNDSLAKTLCARPQSIINENTQIINKLLQNEEPFVFVLVNTKTYQKNKKLFEKYNYSPINQKNGSWYMQKLQKNASENIAQENVFTEKSDFESKESKELFINQGRENLKTFLLTNNIPVTFKLNKNTTQAAIAVCIKGGKFYENGNIGFESVMTNAFSNNIQKELEYYGKNNLLDGFPNITAETLNNQSIIYIVCQKEDVISCLRAISQALIFSDIQPVQADSIVYSEQTQKRLFNANPVNQMYFRGIKYLYDDSSYRDIFDTDKDILQKTSYTDILAAYPKLLDASRYSVVITGNFDFSTALQTLDQGLGLLTAQEKLEYQKEEPTPDFPAKSKRVNLKLRHLFYTDVKAEDAGPMPAVLVPTKEFSDPLQYWFKEPPIENQKERLIFKALLLRLSQIIEEQIDTRLLLPEEKLPFAVLTFLNVSHTQEAEKLYSESIRYIKENASNVDETENIKTVWIIKTLLQTKTNKGTAKLIALGSSPSEYLDDYQTILNATPEEFNECAQKYIPDEPLLKIYSSDSKK